ncbi:precorrin-2 C(20)-methyltransferase [Larsenimonas salina]|uniref:precorrin-2 C(20)-methyltransferase n=1 Tax=Larsenimonas salina TaxID=1295565 RepID=UPI0020744527|nr:precorrin-2 C(20)-methyltransferase [Larsenimonas salina]MCM5703651.1 precorrin-2 C(20)-methyltransferase [Larsenimonas salina]
MSGTFFGLGVGPGDPELLTLKAHRLLQRVDVVCFITNKDGYSLAADIARESLPTTRRQRHLPIEIAMCRDRTLIEQAYDQAAAQIGEALDHGHDVAFLCEGDPLFYGSFAYLLARLAPDYPCTSVPGISSLQAAGSALTQPLTTQGDRLAVISGLEDERDLLDALERFETVFIMKGGRRRHHIAAVIERAGRAHECAYLEHISTPEETRLRTLSRLPDGPGPYFSVFVVSRHHRSTP